MPSVNEFIFMIGFSVGFVAPLAYALTTLIGMRRKRMYPILRIADQKGRLLSPVWTGSSGDELELHPVSGSTRFRSLTQEGG
jgi:hypothetical protein